MKYENSNPGNQHGFAASKAYRILDLFSSTALVREMPVMAIIFIRRRIADRSNRRNEPVQDKELRIFSQRLQNRMPVTYLAEVSSARPHQDQSFIHQSHGAHFNDAVELACAIEQSSAKTDFDVMHINKIDSASHCHTKKPHLGIDANVLILMQLSVTTPLLQKMQAVGCHPDSKKQISSRLTEMPAIENRCRISPFSKMSF